MFLIHHFIYCYQTFYCHHTIQFGKRVNVKSKREPKMFLFVCLCTHNDISCKIFFIVFFVIWMNTIFEKRFVVFLIELIWNGVHTNLRDFFIIFIFFWFLIFLFRLCFWICLCALRRILLSEKISGLHYDNKEYIILFITICFTNNIYYYITYHKSSLILFVIVFFLFFYLFEECCKCM